MRVWVISIGPALLASAIWAAHAGYAGYIASGLKALTVLFAGLSILIALNGGIRISAPHRARPRLHPRVRRSLA